MRERINHPLARDQEEENTNLEARHKMLQDFIEDFTQQINRSIMVENKILTVKLDEVNKLLNELYEGIDESYTEKLKGGDELAIVRAEAQLKLITSIINEVEGI